MFKNKEYIIKRVKGFGWNMLSVIAIAILTMLVEPEMAEAIGINGIVLIILKEVLAQVTKALNKQ